MVCSLSSLNLPPNRLSFAYAGPPPRLALTASTAVAIVSGLLRRPRGGEFTFCSRSRLAPKCPIVAPLARPPASGWHGWPSTAIAPPGRPRLPETHHTQTRISSPTPTSLLVTFPITLSSSPPSSHNTMSANQVSRYRWPPLASTPSHHAVCSLTRKQFYGGGGYVFSLVPPPF